MPIIPPLSCVDLFFKDGKQSILQDISLSFSKKEIVGIIGNNGAGKSTLLKLLSKILTPSTGQVYLHDISLQHKSRRHIAQHIAWLAQSDTSSIHNINSHFSAKDIVAMGRYPHLHPLQRQSVRDQALIDQALSQMNLTDLAHKPLHTLSGGEQQRVYLARALTQQTEILLMDEPTTHLDAFHQHDIMHHISLLAAQGHLVIMVMHDLQMAAHYCHRLVLLSKGKVIADGPVKNVLTQDHLLRYFRITPKDISFYNHILNTH